MSQASLLEISGYCDRVLRTSEITDWDGAVNGLQVANNGRVTRIAAMVDASLVTVKMAIAAKADLLVVHHGLFWSKPQPWIGKKYELLRLLIENNLAVYSSHLPLDLHPKLGNNALLAKELGLKKLTPFFFSHGQNIGVKTRLKMGRADLVKKLAQATSTTPLLVPGGGEMCQNIGIVTGGAGAEVKQAVAEGVDTFITGEGPHWSYALAEELGVNLIYGGHYATETFGVKALAAELSRKFKLSWVFLDHPTGL